MMRRLSREREAEDACNQATGYFAGADSLRILHPIAFIVKLVSVDRVSVTNVHRGTTEAARCVDAWYSRIAGVCCHAALQLLHSRLRVVLGCAAVDALEGSH
eukprot:1303942-Rhodomonas_salina.1